jgi:tetratricopeptide (TPR) repeat protein
VSVYEEWSTGPLPGRHVPLALFEAMQEDKLLPIAELDRGFIRPTYQAQVIVSYMQAGLICEYIAGRWGQQGLRSMLTLFGEGRETADAVEAALGIDATEFDADFAAYLAEEFDPLLENLEAWQGAQREAHEIARAGDWPKALTTATRAVELYPDYVDEGSAYLLKARAHDEASEPDQALATLQEYHRRGGHDPTTLRRLADRLYARGAQAQALEVLEDLILVAPLQRELHADLGDRLLEAERPNDALVEYQIFAALDPHDKAAAHFRLARAYHALDDATQAREQLLYALEIAPHYREAQQLLLEIVR